MFLDKLSKKEKIGIFISIGVLTISGLDRLVLTPIRNRIQKIDQSIKISEKQLEWDLRNMNQKESITQEYQKYIQYVSKSGSDAEEVEKILGEIETLARQSAINLVDMKPQSSREIEFYKQYYIEVEVEGEIDVLIKFLHQINVSSLLLRAEKLRMKLQKKDSAVIKSSMLISKVLVQ